MGFKDELDKVLEATPETKQTLLFSATFPKEVEAIAENYMINPAEVSSGEKNSGTDNVKHVYYQISERTSIPLKRIADINPDIYAIIFFAERGEKLRKLPPNSSVMATMRILYTGIFLKRSATRLWKNFVRKIFRCL